MSKPTQPNSPLRPPQPRLSSQTNMPLRPQQPILSSQSNPALRVTPTHLQKAPVLKDFPVSGLELICDIARRKFLRVGQILFDEGAPSEALYLVIEGRVQLTMKAEDGRVAKLGALGEGELLGQSALLDDATHHLCTAMAESETLLIEITAADFQRLSQEKPRLGVTLKQFISVDLDQKLLSAGPALRPLFIRAFAS